MRKQNLATVLYLTLVILLAPVGQAYADSGAGGEAEGAISGLTDILETVGPPLAILSLIAVGIFQYILSPLLPNTNKDGVRNVLIGLVLISAAATLVGLFDDLI
jgi:hypothetical protein